MKSASLSSCASLSPDIHLSEKMTPLGWFQYFVSRVSSDSATEFLWASWQKHGRGTIMLVCWSAHMAKKAQPTIISIQIYIGSI